MPHIAVPFAQHWEVRLPVVVRQMHIQYVEDFFRDGSLRLSSFEAFRRHPDEQRRDCQEGTAVMEIEEPNGRLSILGANAQEAYVLCASLGEPACTGRPADAGFIRIHDTVGFAAAVSRQINGFVGGSEGPCRYSHDKIVRKAGTRSIQPPKSAAEAESWFAEQNEYVGRQAIDAYFLKNQCFSHENEYRLIWFAEGERKAHIDIKCPAALKFCERA